LFEHPQSFGIVTDGDGDRGMLLRYEKETDCVRVYDGDEEAFLIMGLFRSQGRPSGGSIVCTLESDIMSSVSFAETFGCHASITDVGDKWICNCDLDDLTIGFESSGHVIIPVELADGQLLLSGNGLLTAALAAAAFKAGCDTFRRGFSRTSYTYYVNKQLFQAGTELFESDAVLLDDVLSKALAGHSGLSFSRRAFKDRNVLAFQVERDGLTVALIVSRNSGTEDKNAVYLKCTPDLTGILLPVADALVKRHREVMRNENLPEMAIVKEILSTMEKTGSYTVSEAQSKDTMFTAVLHALEREGRIKGDGKKYIPAV
jgi:phosphomannomutase